MAVVHFVRKVPLADGSLVPASGFLYFTPTARRIITGTPDVVVLPVGFQVRLVDGAADVTLEPTTGAWVWRVQESLTGTTSAVYHVTVPNTVELDDTDLVRVDPATLEPAASPDPIWEAEAEAKYSITLVHDGTDYPARPAGSPAGHVTYIGPTQPTTWLANDQWVNNA